MSISTARAPARAAAQERLARNVIISRARRGLSQAELADRAGISRTKLSHIEGGGGAGLDIVDRLAAALSVDVTNLFARDRGDAPADDAELEALATEDDTVDARTLLAAVDEAAGHAPERYSRAGRPRLAG